MVTSSSKPQDGSNTANRVCSFEFDEADHVDGGRFFVLTCPTFLLWTAPAWGIAVDLRDSQSRRRFEVAQCR
jgi:hypothetical protein